MAGVDIHHCSRRRFWAGGGSAPICISSGWVGVSSGKPTITVGSVSMRQDMRHTIRGAPSETASDPPELMRRPERGGFDLVAVGRALTVDPDRPRKIRGGSDAGVLPLYPGGTRRIAVGGAD